jgi:shikimate kinase
MKIVLIGFMGSGKSHVAQVLGQKLRLPVLEMDDMVVQKSGKKSVAEIFLSEGEIKFRELEMEVCRMLRKVQNMIISCGGGVVMNQLNMDYLKENEGIIISLDISWEMILERCGKSDKRPLMKDRVKAKQLYDLRQPLYEYYADITIDRGEQSVEQTAQTILQKLATL